MHATMERRCVEDVLIAHPILQALFTFLQMHFLFVNSQVIVERFGLFARFGFMHLVATNLALWVRAIVWESANEWLHHVYNNRGQPQRVEEANVVSTAPIALGLRSASTSFYGPYSSNYFSDRSFIEDTASVSSNARVGGGCNETTFPISQEHMTFVISLYECFEHNTLGKLWTSSMPYLFPFIVEYR